MKILASIILSTCMVVAYISDYADYQYTEYTIDKIAGSGYFELDSEYVEYQTIEIKGEYEDVQGRNDEISELQYTTM